MKKFLFIFLPVIFFMAACGNDNGNDKDENTGDSTKTENVTVEKLTPNNIDLNKPLTPEELEKAVFAWKNIKEITVTGYCNFFFDNGKIDKAVELLVNAGDEINRGDPEAKFMKCEMMQEYPEEFEKTIPVTIKGELELDYGRNFVLKNAELVKKGEVIESKGFIDAGDYKGQNISLGDFYDSYFGWMDKEVTVIGYYKSTTTSTTSFGETTRVDLGSDSGDVTVGCRMAEGVTIPEDLATNRKGVIIKGIIKGEAFDNVVMEECNFVNR